MQFDGIREQVVQLVLQLRQMLLIFTVIPAVQDDTHAISVGEYNYGKEALQLTIPTKNTFKVALMKLFESKRLLIML